MGLVALAMRVAFALLDAKPPGITGDADWYHEMANLIADGKGFVNPFEIGWGNFIRSLGDAPPTAFHPPLFPALLALPSLVGLDSYTAHELFGCVMGAATAVVIALVGRELAGPRVGVIAGLVAAVSPTLIGADSVLMSESLYGLLVAAILLAAVIAVRAPTGLHLGALGLAIGLAALTRGEGLFWLIFLAAPLAVAASASARQAAGRFGLVALLALLTIAPWTARNWTTFDRPVLVTTTDGAVIAGANSDATYFGQGIGSWGPEGIAAAGNNQPLPENEAATAALMREHGIAYAKDHKGRVPAVAAARVLRTYGLWEPTALVNAATSLHGESARFVRVSLAWGLLMLVGGAAGYVVSRARHRHLWILLTPALLVAVTSLISYGDTRFRVALDVSLAVLVALGLERLLERRRAQRA